MSELTYKKIIDVEQVESLNDAATVFINDNGAMKQVAADKFGTVKTVNGVLPDENGAITSYHSVSFNFIDGSAVVPGLINYYGTATMAELCEYYRDSGTYNVECRRIIMTSGNAAQSRNCIGEEIVKDTDGNTTGRKLFFGDDLCPVILDIASNSIIFDPDWVAPTSDITIPSGATLTIEEGATVVDNAGALGGSGGAKIVAVTYDSVTDSYSVNMTYDEVRAMLGNGEAFIAVMIGEGRVGLFNLVDIASDNKLSFTEANDWGAFYYNSNGTFTPAAPM